MDARVRNKSKKKAGQIRNYHRTALCVLQMIHEKVYDEVLQRLKKAYTGLRIGDPLDSELQVLYHSPLTLGLQYFLL